MDSQPESHEDQNSKSKAPEEQSLPRSTLMDHAAKFLEDESIRDAPMEEKAAFLKMKGLTPKDIQELLGTPPEGPNGSITSKDEGMTGSAQSKVDTMHKNDTNIINSQLCSQQQRHLSIMKHLGKQLHPRRDILLYLRSLPIPNTSSTLRASLL